MMILNAFFLEAINTNCKIGTKLLNYSNSLLFLFSMNMQFQPEMTIPNDQTDFHESGRKVFIF